MTIRDFVTIRYLFGRGLFFKYRENFFAIRKQCLLLARHNSPIIHLSVYTDDLMTFFNLLMSPNVAAQDLVRTNHQFRSHNDDRNLHNFHYLIYLTT